MSDFAAAQRFFAHPWTFLLSAPHAGAMPVEGPPEVAFAGRSNVGKSSLLNALVGQGGLARTSNTPGRTQALNFFVVDEPGAGGPEPRLAIVDMPGYGFARAPRSQVESWTRLVFAYMRGRATLKRVFVLIDSRHGIKKNDEEVFDLLDKAAVSYQVIATKTDKVKPGELDRRLAQIGEALRKRPAAHPEVLPVSALKKRGIAELRAAIYALIDG